MRTPTICRRAYIKLKTGAKVCIGEHIREVQRISRYSRHDVSATDLSRHLFKDGERFKIGGLDGE